MICIYKANTTFQHTVKLYSHTEGELKLIKLFTEAEADLCPDA